MSTVNDEVNPNPRGYAAEGGRSFVDLGRVDAVFRDPDGDTLIFFADRVEPVRVTWSEENHRLLINALLIYRSNR